MRVESKDCSLVYTIALLVIHDITPSHNHPQMPWSAWQDFTMLWNKRQSALKAFWLGWCTGATTFREWDMCTGLSCTSLWVICIFTCWWNRPHFSDYSLHLWIEMSAKYARACQNPGLGRFCRYSLLHRLRLEGLSDFVDSSCDIQLKDDAREIFLPKDGAEIKRLYVFVSFWKCFVLQIFVCFSVHCS